MDDIKQVIRKVNTQLLTQNKSINSLAFLTTSKSAAQPTLIANLAIMYAQSGKKTVIIDTDFSTDRFSGAFKLSSQRGLADYLEKNVSYQEIIQDVQGIDLSVVLSGNSGDEDTSYYLDDPKFNELISKLTNEYDLVIINTAQYQGMQQLQNVFHTVKDIMLVIDEKDTSKRQLIKLVKSCIEVDGNILGYVSAK